MTYRSENRLLRACRVALVGALLVPAIVAAGPIFVEFGTSIRYLANSTDPGINGLDWTLPAFDDSTWGAGNYGVGFETATGAENLLQTTVAPGAISIYSRTTFDVPDIAAISVLQIGADYDDGWIAWLNGVEVVRTGNFPAGAPAWDTFTTGQHESSNGITPVYDPFTDITAIALPLLQPTGNVLAVGVWNRSATSSDLVLVPKLEANPVLAMIRGPYLQLATPDAITIRWRTNSPTDSVVQFGFAPTALTQSVSDPALVPDHEVRLTGLVPDTMYYYSVGTSSTVMAGADPQHHFTTPPLDGVTKPMRVWIIGDSGTANADARRVRDAYLAETAGRQTDLWLMLGDNAYQTGTDTEYQAAVFDTYPSLLRTSTVWPTFGNHDGMTSDSTNESGPYFDMFTLPANADSGGFMSGTEAYYSFDYGNVHFVCLDSEGHDTSNAMVSWLQTDLANTTQDWIVAYFHHGPYNKGSHDSDTESHLINMRQNLVPILETGGVDAVFSGHSHSYERSFLIDDHTGDSSTFDPVVHLVDGGDGRIGGDGAYTKPTGGPVAHAGAVYTVAGSSGKTDSGGTFDHPAMFIHWLELGSVVLEVNCDRLDARFIDDSGAVLDNFTILKGSGGPPLPPATLVATMVSATEIDLTWNDLSNNETGFVIERSPDGVTWSYLTTVPADAITYRDSGLTPATTYWYRVQAESASCTSPFSNTDSATTDTCAVPGSVGNALLMVKSAGDIDVYWVDVADATSYNIYEDTIKSGPFATLTVSGATGATGVTITWPPGPRLYYRIAGDSPCGEGP